MLFPEGANLSSQWKVSRSSTQDNPGPWNLQGPERHRGRWGVRGCVVKELAWAVLLYSSWSKMNASLRVAIAGDSIQQ